MPSFTAQSVAQTIVLLARHRRYGTLVPDDERHALEVFLGAIGGLSGLAPRLLSLPALATPAAALAEWVLPGIALHLGIRKRWIEKQVRRAHFDGVRQLVVLGAGFDALSWRLHRQLSDMRCWEIDQEGTHRVKLRGIERIGHRDSLTLHAADLDSSGLAHALAGLPGFTTTEPAAFVAEGVLMYLEPDRARRLLAAVCGLAPSGSLLLASALAPDASGRLAFEGARPLVNKALRVAGEPFRSALAPADIAALLSAAGMTQIDTWTIAEVADEFTGETPPALPRGEYLVRAERTG